MIRGAILFILLMCSTAWAGQGMGPGPGVKAYSASCSSGTVDSYNNHILGSGSAMTLDSASNQVKGQSFQLSASGQIYSLIFHTASATGSPTTVTCRIGPEQNLSSTYYAEASRSFANGENEVVFQDTAHTLNAGTTYYWGCSLDAGEASIYYANDTIATGQYMYGVAWDMANTLNTRDMSYAIKVCQ